MDWDSPVILGGNLAVHFTDVDTFVITVGDRAIVETEVDSGALRVLSHFIASRTPREVFSTVASAEITEEVFEAGLEEFLANGVLVSESRLTVTAVATEPGSEVANPRIYDEERWHTFGCNLCTLYDLTDQPIRALKTTGRGVTSEVAKVVELVSNARDFLAKERPSRAAYLRHCQLLRHDYCGLGCNLDDCFFSPRWVNHAEQD